MFGDAEGGSAGEKSLLWLKLSILTHYKFYNSNNFTSSHHTVDSQLDRLLNIPINAAWFAPSIYL